ncbi:MAG: tetratricopeptide repeat protein [Myxococcales bacterium]|nr:tetratricopeptide repeat protein [Myxococcales bacterium]
MDDHLDDHLSETKGDGPRRLVTVSPCIASVLDGGKRTKEGWEADTLPTELFPRAGPCLAAPPAQVKRPREPPNRPWSPLAAPWPGPLRLSRARATPLRMRALQRLIRPSIQRPVALALALLVGGCVGEEARRKAAGNVLFHNGDLIGAAREYRAAIAAKPEDSNGHTLLGNVLFEQNQLDEAKRCYQDAVARDPKAREARRGLATVALRQGDIASARQLFEALTTDAPNDPEAQSALGKLLLSQGDLDGAEPHLRAALAVASNDPSALYCLGLTLAKKKQRAAAQEVFDRLEAAAPGQPFAPYGCAVAAAIGGDRDEALRWLATALQRGIGDLDAVVADPAFSSLKTDPRFVAAIAEARTRAGPKR